MVPNLWGAGSSRNEKTEIVDVSSRVSPGEALLRNSRYWTPTESRRMEELQASEEQLSPLQMGQGLPGGSEETRFSIVGGITKEYQFTSCMLCVVFV